MSVPMRMIGPKLLLKPYVQEAEVPESGLIVGASAIQALKDKGIQFTDDEPPIGGTVVAVGKHYCEECGTRAPLPFREGQLLMFMKSAGQIVTLAGETYYVLLGQDILGEVLPLEEVHG